MYIYIYIYIERETWIILFIYTQLNKHIYKYIDTHRIRYICIYIYICTEYKIQYTVYICDIQPAPQIPRTSRIAAGALLNFPVCWWCMPAPDRLRRLTVCLGHEDFWMTLSLPGPWSLWLHHGRRKMWNIASAKNGWQIRSTWSTSVLVRAKPQHLWILLGSHQGPGAATLSRGRCGAAIGPSQRRLVGRSPGGPLPGSLGPAKRLGPGGPPPLAPGQGLAVAGAGAVQWEVGNVAAAAGAEGLDFGATNWEPWRPWRLSWTRDTTGWWFGTFFIFPYIGNNHPNWLIFFRGVQTTNQYYLDQCTTLRCLAGQEAGLLDAVEGDLTTGRMAVSTTRNRKKPTTTWNQRHQRETIQEHRGDKQTSPSKGCKDEHQPAIKSTCWYWWFKLTTGNPYSYRS